MSEAPQFVAVERHIIEDDRLSLEARAVFIYLLSRSADYRLKVLDLVAITARSRLHSRKTVIYSCLRELIELGYLSRQKFKGGDVRYTIHPTPITKAAPATVGVEA